MLRETPNTNGGRLQVGNWGNRGGTGRPPSIIRAGMREALDVEWAKIREHVAEIERLTVELAPIRGQEKEDAAKRTQRIYDIERLLRARGRLADFLAQYGLGMKTEIDIASPEVRARVSQQLEVIWSRETWTREELLAAIEPIWS